MVLVSMVGLSFCQSPIAYLTLGVFIKPLSDTFGWGRGAISLALSLAALSQTAVTPSIGRLIDRAGARRIILPSMAGFGLLMMSLSLLTPSLLQFYGTFILIGIVGAGANNIGFMRVVSVWFKHRRGLALGLTATGVALGIATWPAVAARVIQTEGWRAAFLCLGAVVLLLGLPLVAAFLRESPAQEGPPGAGPADPPGLTLREALRGRDFRLLVSIAFIMALALNGTEIHLVPLLIDHGLSAAESAGIFSVLGCGIILSRLAIGRLLDTFFGPHVALFAFAAPFIATLLLLFAPATRPMAAAVAVLLSVGAGAESDVLGYLSSRYFGLRSFSEIYGYVFGAFMVGSAVAPYVFGVTFDLWKSYLPALTIAASLFLALCLLFARLGPYPGFEPDQVASRNFEPSKKRL